MTDKDPWAGESGGLTNYEGTVIDAHFGSDPAYNVDTRFLQLTMDTDSPEQPRHEERYNLPPDWETWDGGKTVVHKSNDDRKQFNTRSQVQVLINKIATNCPEAMDVLRSRGNPKSADVWVGLRFFMEETATPYKFKNAAGEQVEVVSTKNHPTKFLGVVDVAAGTGVQSSLPTNGQQVISAADKVLLTMHAKNMEHGEWVEKVMELDGGRLLSNSELVSMLADETGLYATLRNGG